MTGKSVAAGGARPGPQAHRVIFIDLARALAVVMMLYGHTVDALLGREYRTGLWFDLWTFQRGQTSCLFLLLSGFAFSIATTRHWALHVRVSAAVGRRLRRFALFAALGYALHFPVSHVADLASVAEPAWRGFVAVDVLQLIGVTLGAMQLLVLVSRGRRVFMVLCLALASGLVVATPAVWRVEWTAAMPPALAAYLSPSGGSQFPVFPWSAYVLLGAALGQIYARWGAGHLDRFTAAALLGAGAIVLGLVTFGRLLAFQPFGAGAWSWVPADFLVRSGVSLVLLGILAYASRRLGPLPHIVGAVAQESLLIYFVHLCIVYGSIWNPGLAHLYSQSLGPVTTGLVVILLVGAMVGLAWGWNRLKHVSPRAARWVTAVVAAVLIWRLR